MLARKKTHVYWAEVRKILHGRGVSPVLAARLVKLYQVRQGRSGVPVAERYRVPAASAADDILRTT